MRPTKPLNQLSDDLNSQLDSLDDGVSYDAVYPIYNGARIPAAPLTGHVFKCSTSFEDEDETDLPNC